MKGIKDEIGTILKSWKNRIPVCVVYPDSYYTGMSNLATHLLYKTLNDMDWVVCERAFFSSSEEILSVETKKRLKSFEILFFSVSYELHYINVLSILKKSGITLKSRERKEGEPLIVGGGINVIANPEPLSEFFDLFIIGDIEATITEFMDHYLELRTKKRERLLEEISSLRFVYYPGLLSYSYDSSGRISSFNPFDYKVKALFHRGETLSRSCILTGKTEFKNMYLIEGTRGCPSKCPFCLIGNIYDFVFDKELEFPSIPDGVKDVGIVGGGISFHPRLVEIIESLSQKGINVHLPSLRIDMVDCQILGFLRGKLKTITFGIEAGSDSLRYALGKPIGDEEILHKVEEILRIGDFNFKLYFMIGLPGEELSDIEAIVELTKRIRHLILKEKAKKGVVPRLTVHVSPFVPKPVTPFQWVGMEEPKSLEEKMRWLKGKFSRIGNVIFTHESIKYSFVQASLARADRRISEFLLKVSLGENIKKASSESHINLGFYALRKREIDEIMPWDFIDIGLSKENLIKKFHRYLTGLNRSKSCA